MGCCFSCEAAAVAAMEATAKVVLPDGVLREYARPVAAAGVLGKDAACFFVCDADEMEIDGFVSAVPADEELSPGQLYFVLPRSTLSYRLRAEEIAALAVKARVALQGACSSGTVAPLDFPAVSSDRRGVKPEMGRRRSQRDGGGRGQKFSPMLIPIPE